MTSSYLGLRRDTVAFVAWTTGVFLIAAGVRAFFTSKEQLSRLGIDRWKLFKRRGILSMIILGMICCYCSAPNAFCC